MSQWGTERSFMLDDGRYCRVLAHVRTAGFEPLTPDAKIDSLHLTHVSLSAPAAIEFVRELSAEWVGRPYREWLAAR
jgi:hypothetical protein